MTEPCAVPIASTAFRTPGQLQATSPCLLCQFVSAFTIQNEPKSRTRLLAVLLVSIAPTIALGCCIRYNRLQVKSSGSEDSILPLLMHCHLLYRCSGLASISTLLVQALGDVYKDDLPPLLEEFTPNALKSKITGTESRPRNRYKDSSFKTVHCLIRYVFLGHRSLHPHAQHNCFGAQLLCLF